MVDSIKYTDSFVRSEKQTSKIHRKVNLYSITYLNIIKKSAVLSTADFPFLIKRYNNYLTGVVDAESIFILILSGLVIFVVMVSVVAGGTLFCVVSTVAESRLLVDIVDSLVPQLTANIPIPMAVNKNFFILFYFGGVLIKKQQLFLRRLKEL